MGVLGRLYDVQPDEKTRSDFLAQQLNSVEPGVKLWALGKVDEMRRGTGKSRLSEQVESVLLGLVSHRDKRVRLRTANSSLMGVELDDAASDQLRIEEIRKSDTAARRPLKRLLCTLPLRRQGS